jgi:hypothetical protein
MKSKEKAKELIQTFFQNTSEIEYDEGDSSGRVSISFDVAKECALICVDECIKMANIMDGGFSFEKEINFWEQVKSELEAMY